MVYSVFKKILGICVGVVLLSACVRTPAMKTYFFNDMMPQNVYQTQGTPRVLFVSTPTAAQAFQSKEMLYVQRPFQLSPFARHEWAAPPAQMLLPLLVQRIQKMNHFYAVVSAPYTGLTDLRLNTRLIALYQSFQGKKSQVVLEIQAELLDVTQARLIKSQLFCVRVDAPQNTPYGGVVAANQAVQAVLEQIALFVSVNSQGPRSGVRQLPKPKRAALNH